MLGHFSSYFYQLYLTTTKKSTGLLVVGLLVLGGVGFWSGNAQAYIPNDPRYADQSVLWNQINAPLAWDFATGSSRVVVAIIDTGLDFNHQDLKNNVWKNPNELEGNGLDSDGNGFINDVRGWNFIENNNDVRPPLTVSSSTDSEAVRHSTIIAGLIGAKGDNNLDGVGLNWRISLMPIRALDDSGEGDYVGVAKAVDYAVDNGAHVISMSFVGSSDNAGLKESLRRAYKKGVVVVVAGGNHISSVSGDTNFKSVYPACYDIDAEHHWLIGVGSVNNKDQLSKFSNFGDCIDLMAPGERIYSTELYEPGSGYSVTFGGPRRGTSFAAPIVAGGAAIIKAIHPEWGPDMVMKTLYDNADSIDFVNPLYTNKLGHGRLNLGRAVQSAVRSYPAVDRPISFYTHTDHQIEQWNSSSNSFSHIASFPEAQVVAVGTTPLLYDQLGGTITRPTVLIKRDQYYYLRFLTPQGRFKNEVAVPLLVYNKKTMVVKRLKAFRTADQDHFMVEYYNSQEKITTWTSFNERGDAESSWSMPGVAAVWDVDDRGELTVAELIKKKLTARLVNWNDKSKVFQFVFEKVDAVDDIKLASVWGGEYNQSVLLIHQGRELRELLADLSTNSSRIFSLAEPPANLQRGTPPWKLAIIPGWLPAQTQLIPFSPLGNTFTALNVDGQAVYEVTVPTMPGAID